MAAKNKPNPDELPRFCTAEKLASLFACTAQWITRLTQDGVISRDAENGNLYNTSDSVKAYIKYLRDKAAGREQSSDIEDLERQKLAAEIRIKENKAGQEEYKLLEMEGKMHRSEDVLAMTTDLIYAVRGSLLALPGRLAIDVSSAQSAAEASNIIRKEVGIIMQSLSDYEYDPKKYAARVRERLKWEQQEEKGNDESS